MDALAVGLLLLILGSSWGGFIFILKKIGDVEKKVTVICTYLREKFGFEVK